ncbi:MAG TPA: C10 family peptidase [Bacteroidales bacterium]|nr:C10 family peptidase [Bacteroidales bacterium]HSA44102.1 C10 family peptidase [Bacteroidales bacterium]
MSKRSLFLISILVSIQAVYSQAVQTDRYTAATVARNFYYERARQFHPVDYDAVSTLELLPVYHEGRLVYYGISMQPSGWVAVAGCDAVIPVLAYSFEGAFREDDQPACFRSWMEQYAKTIAYCLENNFAATEATQQEWKRLGGSNPLALRDLRGQKAVQALLTSKWDQGKFYNTQCPADPQGPDGHAVTGCVATAMGQIMYYYRWPEHGSGSYTYQHPVYGTLSADFAAATYDWNNMQNQLSSYNDGVAEVLGHLGVSVDMNYGPFGSGMWNHKAAYSLGTYFKYLPSTQYVWRDTTNLDWDSLVISHLDRGQVLYYAGWSDTLYISGHAFVCDGYQDTGYCHFNWGWSGSYDGYFYLNALNPGGSNFNLVQELIINIHPDTLQYTYPSFCQGNQMIHYRQGTLEDGSGPLKNYADNAGCQWLIDPQVLPEDSVSSVTISFQRFDTEAGQDILTIYDGPSTADPVLGTFSGNSLPPAITSTGSRVLITFSSNASAGGKGWLLSYKSNEPEYCSSLTLTAAQGNVSDGSGSKNYVNNSLCNWTIQPPNAAELVLTFTSFDTEAVFDFLEVYDLNTQVLLGKFSGNQIPPPVTAPSGAMYLIFKSNGTHVAQGWEANYTISNLGINAKERNGSAKLFPNPGTGYFILEINNMPAGTTSWSIYDLPGNEVMHGSFDIQSASERKTLQTGALEAGSYFLHLHTGDGSLPLKLIIR